MQLLSVVAKEKNPTFYNFDVRNKANKLVFYASAGQTALVKGSSIKVTLIREDKSDIVLIPTMPLGRAVRSGLLLGSHYVTISNATHSFEVPFCVGGSLALNDDNYLKVELTDVDNTASFDVEIQKTKQLTRTLIVCDEKTITEGNSKILKTKGYLHASLYFSVVGSVFLYNGSTVKKYSNRELQVLAEKRTYMLPFGTQQLFDEYKDFIVFNDKRTKIDTVDFELKRDAIMFLYSLKNI